MASGWQPHSEQELAAVCGQLGADRLGPLSAQERELLVARPSVLSEAVSSIARAIAAGDDPLGDAFGRIRSAAVRRTRGATYTPPKIVAAMVAWAAEQTRPARVVEPGAGSARFLVRAGRAFPGASLVAVELDPLAALVARANLCASGLAERAEVHLADFRTFELPAIAGPTLFMANPPYVRHHHIEREWKEWLSRTAARYRLSASGLCGLHVHFFLATCARARSGDVGAFISASEWLDVNYGAVLRDLLVGPLGLERIDMLDPQLAPFTDAQTTAVITGFRVGSRSPSVNHRKVTDLAGLDPLAGGRPVPRSQLATCSRWSTIARPRPRRADAVELGELCRVHRGQVTGANAVWIAGADTPALPGTVLFEAVTRARQLLGCEGVLRSTAGLRSVIDLPGDLDALASDERERVEAFLVWARSRGADQSYIARHRRPWWSVRLREPAPILATYMARRPPAFVRNLAGARHLNIAHGIYPRQAMSADCLDTLCRYLNGSVSTADGRTYAGGLTKFEPREMERLWVPRPETLAELGAA